MTKKRALEILQKAYDLLKSVPPHQWITETYSDRIGKCCAAAHYARLQSKDPSNFDYDHLLKTGKIKQIEDAFYEVARVSILSVNDNEVGKYPQITPKGRVMAALRDALK